MLPYKLRHPVYGKRFEHLKQDAGTGSEALKDGGPVQRAIQADICNLLPQFVKNVSLLLLQNCNTTGNDTTANNDNNNHHYFRHSPKGTTFQIFEEVFIQSKLHLLHSFSPPKCDQEGYSQLIYASCLDLLGTTFHNEATSTTTTTTTTTNNNDNNKVDSVFEKCSFFIFCLYGLFKTNPLPRILPPLQMVPLGLHSPDQPKALYRRSFAPNIRIDTGRYCILLSLRDLAMSKVSLCQLKCWEIIQSQLKSSIDSSSATTLSKPSHDSKWNCHCALAQDVVMIISQLLPYFDLCEYTGPVSLEGLAGCNDCPVTTTTTRNLSMISQHESAESSCTKNNNPAMNQLEHESTENNNDDTTNNNDTVEQLLSNYKSATSFILRQSNRQPKTSSLPKTLINVFKTSGLHHDHDNVATADPVSLQSDNDESIDENASSFVANNSKPGNNNNTAPKVKQQNNQQDNNFSDYVNQIVLPEGLSEARRIALQKSLITLLQQGFTPRTKPAQPMISSGQSIATQESPSLARNDDNRKDASSDADSVDNSIMTTAQGQAALRSLLQKAAVTTTPRSDSEKNLYQYHNESFLAMDDNRGHDDNKTHDTSEPEIHDQFSVDADTYSVSSTVGRQALERLLAQIKPNKQRKKKSTSSSSKTTSKSKRNNTSFAQSRPKRISQPDRLSSQESTYNDNDNNTPLEDDETTTTTAAGQAALQSLLSKAQSRKRKRNTPKAIKTRTCNNIDADDSESLMASSVGRTALEDLLSHAAQSKNAQKKIKRNNNNSKKSQSTRKPVPTADDSESVAASSVGRLALNQLLSQVGPANQSTKQHTEIPAQREDDNMTVSEEVASVASTSIGRTALESLLSQAKGPTS